MTYEKEKNVAVSVVSIRPNIFEWNCNTGFFNSLRFIIYPINSLSGVFIPTFLAEDSFCFQNYHMGPLLLPKAISGLVLFFFIYLLFFFSVLLNHRWNPG